MRALFVIAPWLCSGTLLLETFSNTALVPPSSTSTAIPSLSFSLPAPATGAGNSAQVSGTFSPLAASNVTTFSFSCQHSGFSMLFAFIDDHCLCQHGGYNNSASGAMDTSNFTLRSRRSSLPVKIIMHYAAQATNTPPPSFSLQWCLSPGACSDIPSSTFAPTLPPAELARRELQGSMLQGWGSWLHRDILSLVLLPEAAVLSLQLCHLPSRLCLAASEIDGNGGMLTPSVRVGSHPPTHRYSQTFVSFLLLNVSIEYARSGDGGRGLDLLVTPQPSSPLAPVEDFALVLAGRFAWGRRGTAAPSGAGGLLFLPAGLETTHATSLFALGGTPLPPNSTLLPPIHLPGLPAGLPCSASRDCASEACSCMYSGCKDGVCLPSAPLPHYALRFTQQAQPLAVSTVAGSSEGDVAARVAAAGEAEAATYGRFGPTLAGVTEAATAALGWRNIFTPIVSGPVMPVTFGFSWISPAPTSNDFAYVLFEWDNVLASFTAGVLGFREAAYSNLIGIVKSKSNGGFIPNWESGGSKSEQAEPMLTARVLLDLHRRFNDTWLVELLADDLVDYSFWAWEERRVVVPGSACCDEPGFITLGGPPDATCRDPAGCVGAYKGESGLDQSPLWDCPGAAPSGDGGNCSLLWSPDSPRVLQIGDAQSTALFAADAAALVELLGLLPGREGTAAVLRGRAEAMTRQLGLLWDEGRGIFANRYTRAPAGAAAGAFSQKLAPTSFYPLLMHAASTAQAERAVTGWLLNATRFCVSADWQSANNPDVCYWGLPSVTAEDATFMQPQSYIYWRGLSWGPQSLLTWWSLNEYRGESQLLDGAREALAAQKGAQVLDMWVRNRHVCENYSPLAPGSGVAPGTVDGLPKSNMECTGWEFYHWGALGGLLQILEAQGAPGAF